MTYACYWRKAMVISICLHIVLVIGAGHLMASLPPTVPKPEEVIIEMDLVSQQAERLDYSKNLEQTPPIPDMIKPTLPESGPVPPMPIEPVVTSSELSMTAAQSLDSSSTSNQSVNSSSVDRASNTGATPREQKGSQGGVAKPSILSKTDPVYPSSARQAGLEGTVILKIEILANGRPGEISVSRSTGHVVLDEAAIIAVEKWRFVPAKDLGSGRTITCTTTLPVSFRLHG